MTDVLERVISEITKPKPGDVIECINDDYYAAKTGQRAVIDSPHYGPEYVMAVFGASAFFGPRHGPPTEDNLGYVSVSGGPCPCIDPADLEHAGTTIQGDSLCQRVSGLIEPKK